MTIISFTTYHPLFYEPLYIEMDYLGVHNYTLLVSTEEIEFIKMRGISESVMTKIVDCLQRSESGRWNKEWGDSPFKRLKREWTAYIEKSVFSFLDETSLQKEVST